jgi:PAS domain-containing protein
MNFNEVVIGIISTIFGGGLASYLTFKIGLKKQGLSEFEKLIEEYKILRESLQKRVDCLEDDIERLREVNTHQREEIVTLRHQLQLFESSHVDIPLPMWMKDIKGKMLFLNSQYEETFLLPRGYNSGDYVGYKDHAVWSKEVSDDFAKNDAKVVRYKKPIKNIEKLDDGSGGVTYCEILKYPRTINGKVIGISGIVLRTADNKEDLK